jgi:flagellar biosynthetic protein FliR
VKVVNLMGSQISVFLLAMSRFAPVMLVPAFTPFTWVPSLVRVIVLLAITLIAVGAQGVPAPSVGLDEPLAMLEGIVGESLLGLSFALAVMLPTAALGFSAHVIDMQSGVAAANLFNPSTHITQALSGTVVQWAATIVFFLSGVHLLLIRGMAASIQLVPLGDGRMMLTPASFAAMLSSQFLLGMMICAPVMLGLFAIDLAVAYASRSMPQANVYFVALPLKVAATFTLLAASLRFAPPLIERLYRNAFDALPALRAG